MKNKNLMTLNVKCSEMSRQIYNIKKLFQESTKMAQPPSTTTLESNIIELLLDRGLYLVRSCN
jgi:hypothetical protein